VHVCACVCVRVCVCVFNTALCLVIFCSFLSFPCGACREDGPHRLLFIEKLVDDRTEVGTSYYELLSHIARQLNK